MQNPGGAFENAFRLFIFSQRKICVQRVIRRAKNLGARVTRVCQRFIVLSEYHTQGYWSYSFLPQRWELFASFTHFPPS